MNVRRLGFWAVIFCLLLLYVLFFEQQKTEEENSSKENLIKVLSIAPEEINGIQVIQNNKKVTLIRKGKSWKVTFPPDAQVKDELLESFISSVVDVVNINVIEENPVNLAQYGLEHPEIKVSIFLKTKSKPITLLIGKDSPAGVSMYAMIKGENRVILVGTYLRFSVKTFMDKFQQ